MTFSSKHVCVIGAGPSGLVVMKELKNSGHTFICFELLSNVGGVYLKSYKGTILTTSSLLTAWSDHSNGKESMPTFWSAEEYLKYLDSFAEKHDLFQHIKFCYKVDNVRRCDSSGKWTVMVTVEQTDPGLQGDIGCKILSGVQQETFEFDAIAVCTGTNTFPSIPSLPGHEIFRGEILHSENYHTPARFEARKVLIVGSGESAADICGEVSKVADKCAIVVRGKHGHLIPRRQANGRVTDLNTNRCRYSNPYVFGDMIGYCNQLAKWVISYFSRSNDTTRIVRKIGELNMLQKTSAFSKFGCKTEGFVAAAVLRGTELHRGSFVLTERHAIFEDGSEFECDCVIACTGYRNCFPFFDRYHPELSRAGEDPRSNYRQIFCADYPQGQVAFFGFARPSFGSIPPTVELQARLYAMVLSGEVLLPDSAEMRRVAAQDRRCWEMRFPYDHARVKGLVDFQLYCDLLAQEMDVMPPLWELFFSKPWLWFKIMFGPFTVHQYRLRGRHADPKQAEAVYARQPVGDLMESSITASFLLLAKVLSKLGFARFNPN